MTSAGAPDKPDRHQEVLKAKAGGGYLACSGTTTSSTCGRSSRRLCITARECGMLMVASAGKLCAPPHTHLLDMARAHAHAKE